MQLSTNRIIALVLLDFVLFGIAVFLMLQVMPKPLKPFDYLLVGGVATLISLLGVWFLIWRVTPNRSGFLFEKRPKQ
ncbi:MAG: hypothetical protein FJW36_22415 [Acidobacteria bacterium]|nr:hypothetical protein [Acidobacteriota bacterium]